jgi:hypothetical protein
MDLCEAPMPRSGPCQMEAGHKGRHAHHEVFTCDGCGKTRRGRPTASHPDAGSFCFLCAPPRYADLSKDLRGQLDW